MWRFDFLMSPSVGASRGCVILYDSAVFKNVVDVWYDQVGRTIIVTFEGNKNKVTVVNLHAPNNHCPDFFNSIFDITGRMVQNYGSELIICGDFNVVLRENLMAHRKCTVLEKKAKNITTQVRKIIISHG